MTTKVFMHTNTQKDYERLHALSKHTHVLSSISRLLDWDHETYMPKDAAPFRAEQLKVLSGLIHKEKVSKKFVKALSKLIDIQTGQLVLELDESQKAAVREWKRDYQIEKALPQKFVEKFTYLTANAVMAWKEARHEKNFKKFLPSLKKIVEAVRKKADLIGFKEHPYDALLDLYEPGMTTRHVDQIFDGLKKSNSELLKRIVAQNQVDDSFLFGNFPVEKQLELSQLFLKDMGFDPDKGRLDQSTHPFSSSAHPTDSRVTTRIKPDHLLSCLSAVLHEGGHSLYEMGLPKEHFGSPLCEAVSLGIHESQSRLWETRIGLSKPFWKHYYPIVKQFFTDQFATDFEQFYRAINKVEPSFIRVEADEVTYPLHVVLRFEIEKQIIENTLPVKELPEVWNHLMKTLLGIRPKNDSEGCLQDVHWSMGAFGYFPTYALGNLYAAEFFEAFEGDYPDWEERVSKGELLFVKEWLREKIFRHGRRWRSLELVQQVCGHSFSEKPYHRYLLKKYGEIYRF